MFLFKVSDYLVPIENVSVPIQGIEYLGNVENLIPLTKLISVFILLISDHVHGLGSGKSFSW